MGKQVKNIKLMTDGTLKLKTGRIVEPKNRVERIDGRVIYFWVNRDRYLAKVNLDDYFRLSLWAHRLVLDHACIGRGVLSYDNGYEHKSLAAAIMQTTKGLKVSYADRNHLNCCKENLVVKENNYMWSWAY